MAPAGRHAKTLSNDRQLRRQARGRLTASIGAGTLLAGLFGGMAFASDLDGDGGEGQLSGGQSSASGPVKTDLDLDLDPGQQDSAQQDPSNGLPAGTPALTWTAADRDGEIAGGHTFQAKRFYQGGWRAYVDIPDCTEVPCAAESWDKDPRPGHFAVDFIKSYSIEAGGQYRVSAAPSDRTGMESDLGEVERNVTAEDPQPNFGQFTMARVVANPVTVNLASERIATTPGAIAGTGLAGTTVGLFDKGAPLDAAPASRCIAAGEDIAGNLGDCTCTVTDDSGACSFAHVEKGGDLVARITASNDAFSQPVQAIMHRWTEGPWGSHTTHREERVYEYAVPALKPAGVTVPAKATTGSSREESSGGMMNVRVNPSLAEVDCGKGLDVAVLVDTSGSIKNHGNREGLEQASKSLISALAGSPEDPRNNTVALFSFAKTSPAAGGNFPTPLSMDDPAKVGEANGIIDGYMKNLDGGTNWDMGLYRIAQEMQGGKSYDLVLVLTDGDPTFTNDAGHGNGSYTTFRDLEQAAYSANMVKAQGARVMAVGIGTEEQVAAQNLAVISGPTPLGGGTPFAEADYVIADWSTVADQLSGIGTALKCEASVTVQKFVQDGKAERTTADGWDFTASTSDAAIDGGAEATVGKTTATADGALPGSATWNLRFGASGTKATVNLAELMGADRAADEWSLTDVACTRGGAPLEAAVDPESATATVQGLGVGDDVVCQFTNTRAVQPVDLTIEKKWIVNNGDPIAHADRPQGVDAELAVEGKDLAWGQVTSEVARGEEVSFSEDWSSSKCEIVDTDLVVDQGGTAGGVTVRADGTGADMTLAVDNSLKASDGANPAVKATVTNTIDCGQMLKLRKQIDGDAENHLLDTLPDSAFTMTATPTSGTGELVWAKNADVWAAVDAGSTFALHEHIDQQATTGVYAPVTLADGLTWACDNADVALESGTETVTIPSGEDVACTIRNAKAEITVLNKVLGDGAAVPADWSYSVTPEDTAKGLSTDFETVGNASLERSGHAPETVEVLPGEKVALTQGEQVPGYHLVKVERYKTSATDQSDAGGFLGSLIGTSCPLDTLSDADDCWTPVADVSSVSEKQLHRGIYRFVNAPIPPDPSLVIDKTWVVNGYPFAHGTQAAGMEAELTVGGTGATFGEPMTVTEGQVIDLGEQASIDGEVLGTTCEMTATLQRVDGDGKPLDGQHPEALDDSRTVTISAGVNRYLMTNTVTCVDPDGPIDPDDSADPTDPDDPAARSFLLARTRTGDASAQTLARTAFQLARTGAMVQVAAALAGGCLVLGTMAIRSRKGEGGRHSA